MKQTEENRKNKRRFIAHLRSLCLYLFVTILFSLSVTQNGRPCFRIYIAPEVLQERKNSKLSHYRLKWQNRLDHQIRILQTNVSHGSKIRNEVTCPQRSSETMTRTLFWISKWPQVFLLPSPSFPSLQFYYSFTSCRFICLNVQFIKLKAKFFANKWIGTKWNT